MKKGAHVSETPATQFLRRHGVSFSEHVYDYVEHGGTAESARQLGSDLSPLRGQSAGPLSGVVCGRDLQAQASVRHRIDTPTGDKGADKEPLLRTRHTYA